MGGKLVLDGNNLLMRSLRAMQGSGLSVDGVATGPLLVFINLMSRWIRDQDPRQVMVCWDGGRSLYREAISSDYKGQRPSHEGDDLKDSAFGLVKEFCSLAGIPQWTQSGVEADDLIAWYWRHKAPGERFVIVSGDGDFLQLVDEWTMQIRPGQSLEYWTEARVLKEFGCLPEHIPFTKALSGDESDGVEGVPGVGQKWACKLLDKYGWSLDLLLGADEPRLSGYTERVRRNLKLVDLRNEGPVLDLPSIELFEPSDVTHEPLLAFCDRYRLATVTQRLFDGILWRVDAMVDVPTLFP
jgi:DNA polymerase-1